MHAFLHPIYCCKENSAVADLVLLVTPSQNTKSDFMHISDLLCVRSHENLLRKCFCSNFFYSFCAAQAEPDLNEVQDHTYCEIPSAIMMSAQSRSVPLCFKPALYCVVFPVQRGGPVGPGLDSQTYPFYHIFFLVFLIIYHARNLSTFLLSRLQRPVLKIQHFESIRAPFVRPNQTHLI